MSVQDDVWREVEAWPLRSRLTLASRILQSAEQEMNPSAEPSEERRAALRKLSGLLKMDNPPTDAEVDRIVEEERLRKYGG